MMTDKINRVYKDAKSNTVFSKEFLQIRDNHWPLFASNLEKSIIGAIYCGWLIGKYGSTTAQLMYDDI